MQRFTGKKLLQISDLCGNDLTVRGICDRIPSRL